MNHTIGNSNDYFTKSLQSISNLLIIQDYNAQHELLMNEGSFQELPFVLSRLHIPLQTPTVIGQKLYIPSTLISIHPWPKGRRAHPILRWSLHNSQGSNSDENEESAFSVTRVHQVFENSLVTHQPYSDTQSFYGCQGSLQWLTLTPARRRVQWDSVINQNFRHSRTLLFQDH